MQGIVGDNGGGGQGGGGEGEGGQSVGSREGTHARDVLVAHSCCFFSKTWRMMMVKEWGWTFCRFPILIADTSGPGLLKRTQVE